MTSTYPRPTPMATAELLVSTAMTRPTTPQTSSATNVLSQPAASWAAIADAPDSQLAVDTPAPDAIAGLAATTTSVAIDVDSAVQPASARILPASNRSRCGWAWTINLISPVE